MIEAFRKMFKVPSDPDKPDFVEDEKVYRLLPPEKAPRGLRHRILREVAVEMTEALSIEITPRRVEACWKEWRSFQAEITRENADYKPMVENASGL